MNETKLITETWDPFVDLCKEDWRRLHLPLVEEPTLRAQAAANTPSSNIWKAIQTLKNVMPMVSKQPRSSIAQAADYSRRGFGVLLLRTISIWQS